MHDQREKAQRDYDWMLSTARQQGIEQGIEQGREVGTVIGAIQVLQQILGEAVSGTQELSGQALIGLQIKLADLQARIRSRLG